MYVKIGKNSINLLFCNIARVKPTMKMKITKTCFGKMDEMCFVNCVLFSKNKFN